MQSSYHMCYCSNPQMFLLQDPLYFKHQVATQQITVTVCDTQQVNKMKFINIYFTLRSFVHFLGQGQAPN